MPRFELTEHQDSVHVETVTDKQRLQQLCDNWLQLEVIALDTEFDRTNTYFHKLALMQVYDGREVYLIDPLQLEDVSPLAEVLASSQLIKALHSCSEDLEALFNQYHFIINNVFDTQIAAAMAGTGLTVGYAAIVEQMLGVSLAKEQTKTDWLQRPLSHEQKVYAAQDVQFLLPIYYKLRDQLIINGHFDYVIEDTTSIFDAVAHLEDFDQYYIKVKGAFKLNSFQLNRLKIIAEWRELLAREKNIPRTFVFRDQHLVEICQKPQPNIAFLLSIGCNRGSIRRYGTELLSQIQYADSIDQSLWPQRLQPFHRIRHGKQLLGKLKEVTQKIAEKEGVPAEVLCNKRLTEYYIKQTLDIQGRPNRFWNDWRRNLLEAAFVAEITQ
ncbi:MAG: ribonuclease D [Kangiellaceae bacterium]|nr:ribonuclease D [Kangiellaceae bacterium]